MKYFDNKGKSYLSFALSKGIFYLVNLKIGFEADLKNE
jgi:hypothetical protein